MASPSPNSHSSAVAVAVVAVVIALLLPSASSDDQPSLIYHGGPLLTGKVDLGLIWYGPAGRVHKGVMRSFIKSLNTNFNPNLDPPVSKWWQMVESYQAASAEEVERGPKIEVKVVRQVVDKDYSIGKVITIDFLTDLANKATKGNNNTVAVIIAARDVNVQGLCMGRCSYHGLTATSNQLYIVLGNRETECPGSCAWPFHKADYGPQGVTLQPPNGNVGADSMVIAFAQALAGLVTNPYNNGFYDGLEVERVEASTVCPGIFASGAFPGDAGKVRVDPTNGGAFNAYGVNGRRFLLPALWDPKASSCWTLI